MEGTAIMSRRMGEFFNSLLWQDPVGINCG